MIIDGTFVTFSNVKEIMNFSILMDTVGYESEFWRVIDNYIIDVNYNGYEYDFSADLDVLTLLAMFQDMQSRTT